MYDNILIPIVFDQQNDHSQAIECAKRLAGENPNITMLSVIELLPSYVMSYVPDKATEERRVELQHEMDTLVKGVPGATCEIISGHPGRAIIDYANANGTNLIIVKSHRPGFQDYFLGSTAAYVVRRAKCAVHVIR
ncbi:universal stress protein [Pelagivirga sediminicola]|uniref:Universal stress protein n=1 Tax=Pelagivirga sediminicola TaxID=2170575 RepID=A0A2T7GAZ6_9RHOB|nr:universal stress protein [Pelagivirga sediminicola]PVA11576.1 universal stress protein [Pelagivirga sediminicola]